jgi:uncharacterized protein YkwD
VKAASARSLFLMVSCEAEMQTHRLPRILILARLTVITASVLWGASTAWAQNPDAQEQLIFQLTNQDRADQGLSALRWNAALARAAQEHAERMAGEPSLSHQYPGERDLMTRAADVGAHFQAIAENIATGPNPEAVEREWMHSAPHRANILDPRMNSLGVAVVSKRGVLYAVEDFAEANEALSKKEIEQRVRSLLAAQQVDGSAPSGPAEDACAMEHGMPRESNLRAVVRFETPDLTHLPAQVEQQIRNGDFRRAAVGACAPTANQSQFTTYHVAILFY